MERHPGGEEHSLKMIRLVTDGPAPVPAGAAVYDFGAGEGSLVRQLQAAGFNARGIDLVPRGQNVAFGDMLKTGLADACADAVFSQCAFYVSGDAAGAFREAERVLKPGGLLAVSDVSFRPSLAETARAAGFEVLYEEDLTEAWRAYFLECIWNGTADPACSEGKKGARYTLLLCRKPAEA